MLEWRCLESDVARDTNTYDGNNNLICRISQLGGGTNAWENIYQYLYAYDSNNNRITRIQQWNGNAWENSSQLHNYL